MKKILIKNVKSFINEDVRLDGWVYNKRSSGKIGFLMLRDGTGILQGIFFKPEIGEVLFNEFKTLTQESSVSIEGKIISNEKADGGCEIQVKNLIIHNISKDYPITPKEHGTDFLMNNRHLWLRSKRQHSIMKIRHEIIKATRDFFDNNDFTLIDTPIFTPKSTERTNLQYSDLRRPLVPTIEQRDVCTIPPTAKLVPRTEYSTTKYPELRTNTRKYKSTATHSHNSIWDHCRRWYGSTDQ